jgi:hypothetical protein
VSAVHWNWMPSRAVWAGCPKMKSSRPISYTLRTARLMTCHQFEEEAASSLRRLENWDAVHITGSSARAWLHVKWWLSKQACSHLLHRVLHAVHQPLQPDLDVALGIHRPLKLDLSAKRSSQWQDWICQHQSPGC